MKILEYMAILRNEALQRPLTEDEQNVVNLWNKNIELERQAQRLKAKTISPMGRELAKQCIKFTKQSDGGFANIPLGFNLSEDIGLIIQAEQDLKDNNGKEGATE